MKEFCPPSEMQNLESEFWLLEQEGGDNATYTTRFHELSLLVPHLVSTLTRTINKYIRGLPMPIKDSVLSSAPKTLSDAITLASTLSDNHVKAGTLTIKGVKKPTVNPPKTDEAEPSTKPAHSPKPHYHNNKKRKQNFAVTNQPAPPPSQTHSPQVYQPAPTKKPYTGPYPQCQTCQRHHPLGITCRQCTKCGRYGHLIGACFEMLRAQTHLPYAPLPYTAPPAQPYAFAPGYARGCYNCGDPSHYRNACPRLAYQVQTDPIPLYQVQTQPAPQPMLMQAQIQPIHQAQPIPAQPIQVQPIQAQPI